MVGRKSFNSTVYLSPLPKQTLMKMGPVSPGYYSCMFGNGYVEISMKYQCRDCAFHRTKSYLR